MPARPSKPPAALPMRYAPPNPQPRSVPPIAAKLFDATSHEMAASAQQSVESPHPTVDDYLPLQLAAQISPVPPTAYHRPPPLPTPDRPPKRGPLRPMHRREANDRQGLLRRQSS